MAGLSPDDLKAAVAAGVIDERAAARLATLAQARSQHRERQARDDEPFEFFRGFGEIFIAVGLVLFFGAFHALTAAFGFELGLSREQAGEPFLTQVIAWRLAPYVVGAALAWLCAVYFAHRRRMSLPSIVLALVFAYDAISLGVRVADLLAFEIPGGAALALPAGVGAIAMLAFYLAFRLPFALAPLALSLLALSYALAQALFGGSALANQDLPAALFDLAQAPSNAFAILLCGLALFLAALRLDMRDPHRISRFSASAFWLHVVAAPAIVNTICLSLYNLGGVAGYLGAATAFVGVAIIAIVIDRRSFLMAGVVYAGLALGAAVRAATGGDFATTALTILLLGAFITVLGAKWTVARGRLMGALPDFPSKDRLPPY